MLIMQVGYDNGRDLRGVPVGDIFEKRPIDFSQIIPNLW